MPGGSGNSGSIRPVTVEVMRGGEGSEVVSLFRKQTRCLGTYQIHPLLA